MGGRGAAFGGSGAGVTAAQDRTIDRIIKRTRDLKNEQFRIVNENGEVVLEKRGTAHEVASTVGEKRQYMEGAVSIHNHPEGGTFSDADLSDFGYGAREMVVASPEGTYRLTNMKYGQYDAKSGWYDMREDMRNKGITAERSFMDIKKETESKPRVQKASQAVSQAAGRWLEAKKAGKPQSVLDDLMNKYNQKQSDYKSIFAEERRRTEVQPYHDYYKANASKFGFKYGFEKRSGR